MALSWPLPRETGHSRCGTLPGASACSPSPTTSSLVRKQGGCYCCSMCSGFCLLLQCGVVAGTGVASSWCRAAWTTAANCGTSTSEETHTHTHTHCTCSIAYQSLYSVSPPPSAKCVVTLRGHADSVNAVVFLPYSNTLATCSADKTLSLWDARTVSLFSYKHLCLHYSGVYILIPCSLTVVVFFSLPL